MPRYFTLQQAERVLPHVETAIRNAIALKAQYQSALAALAEINTKVTMTGGMSVNREQVTRLRDSRDGAAALLKAAMEEIQEFGCEVKDLDIGLLDFPTLYHEREVCLCWRLGESSIQFWHGTDEGFRGRKPIDEEFLRNHRGDALA